MVSIIAMGNTVQSFRDHSFLSEKLYTGKPSLGKVHRLSYFHCWKDHNLYSLFCILP